jgi:hypothetical protein
MSLKCEFVVTASQSQCTIRSERRISSGPLLEAVDSLMILDGEEIKATLIRVIVHGLAVIYFRETIAVLT